VDFRWEIAHRWIAHPSTSTIVAGRPPISGVALLHLLTIVLVLLRTSALVLLWTSALVLLRTSALVLLRTSAARPMIIAAACRVQWVTIEGQVILVGLLPTCPVLHLQALVLEREDQGTVGISIPVAFHPTCRVTLGQVGQMGKGCGATHATRETSILEVGRQRDLAGGGLLRTKQTLAATLKTCCRICSNMFRTTEASRHSQMNRPVRKYLQLSVRTRNLCKHWCRRCRLANSSHRLAWLTSSNPPWARIRKCKACLRGSSHLLK
jgi:hypothetical protein